MELFKNGDPNISVRTILTKDKNPSPINSGDPQGSGRGAKIVGQRAKIPVGCSAEQEFEPPAQFSAPESPMREAPISRITVPVLLGQDPVLSENM